MKNRNVAANSPCFSFKLLWRPNFLSAPVLLRAVVTSCRKCARILITAVSGIVRRKERAGRKEGRNGTREGRRTRGWRIVFVASLLPHRRDVWRVCRAHTPNDGMSFCFQARPSPSPSLFVGFLKLLGCFCGVS